jgi:hypothetical protein
VGFVRPLPESERQSSWQAKAPPQNPTHQPLPKNNPLRILHRVHEPIEVIAGESWDIPGTMIAALDEIALGVVLAQPPLL